jgi:hypothetical protein
MKKAGGSIEPPAFLQGQNHRLSQRQSLTDTAPPE